VKNEIYWMNFDNSRLQKQPVFNPIHTGIE